MPYLLDSNAWIGHFRQNTPEVTQHLKRLPASDVVLCAVVLGELLYGVERSAVSQRAANLSLVNAMRSHYLSLPFDDRAAEQYGTIRADLASRGLMIGPNDLMIAAIALSNACTLVTHNTIEFGRIPGLVVEDWTAP